MKLYYNFGLKKANYLQENGFFELLTEIKHNLGNDVSIDFCKELFKSNDCETVIRVYIPNGIRPDNPGDQKSLERIVNEYYNILIAAGFNPFSIKKYLIKFQPDD